MVTTGIVRKIDSLGRIVLPKEIRYNFSIKEGDDFEILIDGENIILKKYFKINNVKKDVDNVINIFNNNCDITFLICINNKLDNGEEINEDIQNLIYNRKIICDKKNYYLTKNIKIETNNIIYPIVINSDLLGTIISYGNNSIDELYRNTKIIFELIKEKIVDF